MDCHYLKFILCLADDCVPMEIVIKRENFGEEGSWN